MSRLIAIPDTHGNYTQLSSLLDTIMKNFKDFKLIFLGDYCDRGPDSALVMQAVKDATKKGHIALMGNHDEMLLDFANGGDRSWLAPGIGGLETIKSFEKQAGYIFPKANDFFKYLQETRMYQWLEKLPFFYIEDNLIFMHGIPGKNWNGFVPIRNMAIWGHPVPINSMDRKKTYAEWMWAPNGYFAVCGHSIPPPDEDGFRRPLYVEGKGVYLDCGSDKFPQNPIYAAVFENGKLAYYVTSFGQVYKDKNCTPKTIVV